MKPCPKGLGDAMADLVRAQTIGGQAPHSPLAVRGGNWRPSSRRSCSSSLYPFIDQALGLRLLGALLPIGHLLRARHGSQHCRRLRRAPRPWLRSVLRYRRLHGRLLDFARIGTSFEVGGFPRFSSSSGRHWSSRSLCSVVRCPAGGSDVRLRGDYLAIVTSGSARSCRTSSSMPCR